MLQLDTLGALYQVTIYTITTYCTRPFPYIPQILYLSPPTINLVLDRLTLNLFLSKLAYRSWVSWSLLPQSAITDQIIHTHGEQIRNSLEITKITITDSRGLASKTSPLPDHSSSCIKIHSYNSWYQPLFLLRIAQPIFSLGTLSNAFFKTINPK